MTSHRDPGSGIATQSNEALGENVRIPAANAAGVVLALGGGFSRGFAHLGVLEVLVQERIPIAAIVGTSIGSLLGAAFADGIPLQELCDLGRRVRIRDFIRFRRSQPEGHSPQTHSNDRIGQFVRECFRSSRVEELAIPMAIVTTDLDTCGPYVFTNGPLDIAIRASCAFPGLFKPMEYEGRTLADGCIVAPVPTVTAARMNAGCVLGVAVNSGVGSAAFAGNAARQSKRIFEISRGKDLSPSWTRKADILLEPEVQQIDWNDFTRVDEACAAGAQAMRRALPSLRELLGRRAERSSAGATLGYSENRLVS
jgi:NTE family protein